MEGGREGILCKLYALSLAICVSTEQVNLQLEFAV